jgi:hypothetical protein
LHEAGHGTLPHQSKVYALIHDCEKTLDAEITDLFEREANVFASEALFQGEIFAKEAQQLHFGIIRNVSTRMFENFGPDAGVDCIGDFAFGRPSRVTASIAIGREGIIDIERQAELGGPTHTKGVLILGGYLRGKYASKRPFSLAASLAFEQSYGGVDGDSA